METYEIDYCLDEFYFADKTDPMKVSTCFIEAYSQCDAKSDFEWEYGENKRIVKITKLPEGYRVAC